MIPSADGTHCWNNICNITSLVSAGRLVRNNILFGVDSSCSVNNNTTCSCMITTGVVCIIAITIQHEEQNLRPVKILTYP